MTRVFGFRGILAILAVWGFATFWNLDKAFHIDDAGHLEIAQWIAGNPLHPMSGWVNWSGNLEPISRLNQPHLYYYLMAGWGQAFGYSEVSLHCLMAVFSLWAVVAFYRLTLLIEPKNAIYATALFGLSSAFVVGQNSMVDVPLMALWLEFYCTLLTPSFADKKKYGLAALMCSAALLVKYTSLVLLPGFALYILLTKKYRNLFWVLIPVSALLCWSAFNMVDYGGVHILGRPASAKSPLTYVINAIGWVATLGAIMPFSMLVFVASAKQSERYAEKLVWTSLSLISFLVPASVAVSFFADVPSLPMNLVLFFSFFLSGLGVVFVAYRSARPALMGSEPDIRKTILTYWIVSAAAFVVLLAPFMATRHVLLAMPAVLLLVYPYLSKPPHASRAYLLALLLTVSGSMLLAKADHWYAGIYKKMAPAIMKDIPPNSQTWFLGHWGWQWYAQQAGMHQLAPNGAQPSVGDYLVIPLKVDGGDIPPTLDLIEVETIVVERREWYQRYASINLYISPWLPWGYSTEPMEVFKVFQITGMKP